MNKQMLYIQVDTLRFILKELENDERSNTFIIENLRETIERISTLLEGCKL